jgi:hypothetical protein
LRRIEAGPGVTDRIDLALKLVATAIACFGVWKYFADRDAQAYAEAKDRSLGYIARFADADILQARETLMGFWRRQPDFVAHAMSGQISGPAYERFVAATFGTDRDRAEESQALFRTLVLYDEMAFCRSAGICDAGILDEYFCRYAVRHAQVYGPFYEIMAGETGTSNMDQKLQEFATACSGRADAG